MALQQCSDLRLSLNQIIMFARGMALLVVVMLNVLELQPGWYVFYLAGFSQVFGETPTKACSVISETDFFPSIGNSGRRAVQK